MHHLTLWYLAVFAMLTLSGYNAAGLQTQTKSGLVKRAAIASPDALIQYCQQQQLYVNWSTVRPTGRSGSYRFVARPLAGKDSIRYWRYYDFDPNKASPLTLLQRIPHKVVFDAATRTDTAGETISLLVSIPGSDPTVAGEVAAWTLHRSRDAEGSLVATPQVAMVKLKPAAPDYAVCWDASGRLACLGPDNTRYYAHLSDPARINPIPVGPGRYIRSLPPTTTKGHALIRVSQTPDMPASSSAIWLYDAGANSLINTLDNEEGEFLTPSVVRLRRRGDTRWRLVRVDQPDAWRNRPQPAFTDVVYAPLVGGSSPFFGLDSVGRLHQLSAQLTADTELYSKPDERWPRQTFTAIRVIPGRTQLAVHASDGWFLCTPSKQAKSSFDGASVNVRALTYDWYLRATPGDSAHCAVYGFDGTQPAPKLSFLPRAAFTTGRFSDAPGTKTIRWLEGEGTSAQAVVRVYSYTNSVAGRGQAKIAQRSEQLGRPGELLNTYRGLVISRQSDAASWRLTSVIPGENCPLPPYQMLHAQPLTALTYQPSPKQEPVYYFEAVRITKSGKLTPRIIRYQPGECPEEVAPGN